MYPIGRPSEGAEHYLTGFEFDGLLQRFDTERQVEEFVEKRRRPVPDSSDIEILDNIFFKEIRPLLEALKPTIQHITKGLFRTFSQTGYVNYRNQQSSSVALLEPRNWENIKEHHIVSRGFELRDDQQIEVRQDYRLTDYTGVGKTGFDILLSVKWKFSDGGLFRRLTIDKKPIPELDLSVDYSEVGSRSPDADRTIASLCRQGARVWGSTRRLVSGTSLSGGTIWT